MKIKNTTKKVQGPNTTYTDRTATVRKGLGGRTVVKLKRNTETYQGAKGFTGATKSGYKKVYKNGTLKKFKKK